MLRSALQRRILSVNPIKQSLKKIQIRSVDINQICITLRRDTRGSYASVGICHTSPTTSIKNYLKKSILKLSYSSREYSMKGCCHIIRGGR
jgi:hypothetical protein